MIYTRFSFWLSCAAVAFPIIFIPLPPWVLVIAAMLVFFLAFFRIRLATFVEAGLWVWGWYIMLTRNEQLIFWIGLAAFIAWAIATILLYSQFFLLRTLYRAAKADNKNHPPKKRPNNLDGLNFTNHKDDRS